MSKVLWLRPPVPDNVSPGRDRIAEHLDTRGYAVDLCDATPSTLSRAADADVVVGTSHSGAILGAVAALRYGTPFVVDHVDSIRQLHGTNPAWQAWPAQVAESWAFRRADVTLYVTDQDMDRLERHADPYKKTSLGVPYGAFVPPSEYSAPEGWPGTPAAIYVGSLTETYNIRAMCDGAVRAGVKLVVLGTGPLADYVEGHPGVVYPGSVPHKEVPRWLWNADVGICLVDGRHTVKTLEYAAAGLPVVHHDGRARAKLGSAVTYADATAGSVADAIHQAIATGPSDELRELARAQDYSRVADDYEWALERAMGQC